MSHCVRIVCVTDDTTLATHLQIRLQSIDYHASILTRRNDVLNTLFSDPPDLMLIDLSNEVQIRTGIVQTLREDSFFSTIPIIGLLLPTDSSEFIWDHCPLDDFICLPLNYQELFFRISLALFRIKRIFDTNPLTRLPGNTSIQKVVTESLGKPLAVCYLDVNSFKPFNDTYGFAHGDEVIRMLARIMFNAVRESGGGFCGHVGGDDFVCVVPIEQAEMVCRTIIGNFDQIILDLFDEETKARGFYRALNRRGVWEEIPLLSLSIGVVPTNSPRMKHYVTITETAAEVKKKAKEARGSSYFIDRRNS